ncbi:MAG: hypothetical protein JXA35_00640 [Deltaproteobacteria bacterium]|nr:hypothetical protein [Deltaproteobacteria bacterium]
MDGKRVRAGLEALADNLGIEVRHENLDPDMSFSHGGLCLIKNRPVIIIDKAASEKVKIKTLIQALRRFDLGRIYIKPALRDILEAPDQEQLH